MDTQWSMVLTFNSILYLCLSIITVCQCLGAWVWPLCCCSGIGICLGAFAHTACIIVTGVFRF